MSAGTIGGEVDRREQANYHTENGDLLGIHEGRNYLFGPRGSTVSGRHW